MNCKNCGHLLNDAEFYCEHCGGKIVLQRITLKTLIVEAATNVFGWDNKYFVTVKSLFAKPGNVLREYIDGTRKKYMHPLSFLLIGLTIGIFVFNIFTEQYISITTQANESQIQWMAETFGGIYEDPAFQEKSRADAKKSQKFVLDYLNILTIINLPLYALISWIVFRKPYNFGEHLVVNSYLQGIGFLFSTVFFCLAIAVHPSLFFLSLVSTFFMYCYAYKQLYQLGWDGLLLKVLIFIAVMIGLTVILGILFFVIGFLGVKFGFMDVSDFVPTKA